MTLALGPNYTVTMSENKESEKLPYEFGKVEKITVESQELEQSVFALADAMPGGDGIDPTRRIPATY